MRIWFVLAGLLCMALLPGTGLGRAAAPDAATHPALVVTTLDGKTFDLAAERGKWVIVNFWATWCSPCIAEMPMISGYVESHKDVAAIGIAWDRASPETLAQFAAKHPVAYPLARVDTGQPPGDFASPVALPTTYLIAPDGTIAKHFLGPIDAKSLDAAIAAASGSSSTATRVH